MNLLHLAILLMSIETGGHPNPSQAIGDNGRAIGPLQVHPVMVRECNRIVGQREAFSYSDRRDLKMSLSMAVTFLRFQQRRYKARYGVEPSRVQLMCSWQSGGIFNKCDPSYKRKVDKALLRAYGRGTE